MQHISTRIRLGGAVLLLCLSAPLAFADTVNLRITSAPNSYGNQPTTPYNALIDGSPAQVVCLDIHRHVDYSSHVYSVWKNSGPNWAAPGGNPSGSTPLMYDAAAILVAKMLSVPGTPDRLQGMYSFAIWKIFDSTANLPGVGSGGVLAGDQATVDGYISTALADAADPTKRVAYTVYTPLLASGAENLAGQRMMRVPETSAVALLGFNLAGLLGLILVFRRHLVCN